jgi:hypothetical protein
MAKGDHDAAMNSINAQRQQMTNQQNALQQQFAGPSKAFSDAYNTAYGQDQSLRSSLTSGYNSLYNNMPRVSGGIDPSHISSMGTNPYAVYQGLSQGVSPAFRQQFEQTMNDMNTAGTSYKNFINTGGFSPTDIQMMRSQAQAPVAAAYGNAQDQIRRANILAGGNMSNAAAALSRMAPQQSQSMSDTAVNTEANLARMVQAGKEFGTSGLSQNAATQAQARMAVEKMDADMKATGAGGMTDIEKSRLTAELGNAQLNQTASEANQLMPLRILQAQTQLYGTAPGATSQAGGQQLGMMNALTQLQQMSQNGQLGSLEAQLRAAGIPGAFQSGMGNLSSILGLLSKGGGLLSGLGGGGGSSNFGGSANNPGGIDYGSFTNMPTDPGQTDYGSVTDQPAFPPDYSDQYYGQGPYDYGYSDPYFDLYGNDIYNSGSYNDPTGGF